MKELDKVILILGYQTIVIGGGLLFLSIIGMLLYSSYYILSLLFSILLISYPVYVMHKRYKKIYGVS